MNRRVAFYILLAMFLLSCYIAIQKREREKNLKPYVCEDTSITESMPWIENMLGK